MKPLTDIHVKHILHTIVKQVLYVTGVKNMRTERIFVNSNDQNYQAIRTACRLAKNVFNVANYEIRKALVKDNKIIKHDAVDKLLKHTNHPAYREMPNAASAQRVIQVLGKDWKAFDVTIKDWRKNPEKYSGRPKLPSYAKHQKTFVVGRNGFKVENGYLHISGAKSIGLKPIKIMCCDNQPFSEKADKSVVQDVRFVPKGKSYFVEIVYKQSDENKNVLLDKSNVIGIDLGVDNLATITSNQQGVTPVLINGKVIKSVNNKYNRDYAELQLSGKGKHIQARVSKRYNWINDHLHKVSKYIINFCLKTNTGKIVIGENRNWKAKINMGSANNQKFAFIPHAELIKKIKYKAEACGIEVIVTEESYTSKASAMDLDTIPTYGDSGERVFSGRRVKRGLYQTASGKLINADVNGSINILRKVIGDAFVTGLFDSGCVFQPMRVTC